MKTIVFKISKYPLLSETFISSQIITAINCGFNVKIIVRELLDFEKSKQLELIEQFNIAGKIVIEDYNIPKNKICRLLKWLFLLVINLNDLKYIVSFYRSKKYLSPDWLFQLVFYKRYANASIFHVQYGTNKDPIDFLKKIGFIKSSLIVSFHGHDAFFPIHSVIQKKGYYDNLFYSVDAIVANTPFLAKQIEGLGCPNKVLKTIPVGVDTSFFKPKKDAQKESKTLKLITVGRLSPIKGHIYALEVIKNLKDRDFDIYFRIVGEGPEKLRLEQYIQANDLSNYVTLEGRKSRSEIRDLFWQSDLFLFTSVSMKYGRSETQGLATIEANACGLPAIVFDSGGVKYTVNNNETGYIVPEYDVEAMAQKIIELKRNIGQIVKMGLKAVEFVNEYYSHDFIEKKWKVLYERLS